MWIALTYRDKYGLNWHALRCLLRRCCSLKTRNFRQKIAHCIVWNISHLLPPHPWGALILSCILYFSLLTFTFLQGPRSKTKRGGGGGFSPNLCKAWAYQGGFERLIPQGNVKFRCPESLSPASPRVRERRRLTFQTTHYNPFYRLVAFQWSWNLKGPMKQRFISRISVFLKKIYEVISKLFGHCLK